MIDIISGSIGINVTPKSGHGSAVSLQLIGVGKRQCRVLRVNSLDLINVSIFDPRLINLPEIQRISGK